MSLWDQIVPIVQAVIDGENNAIANMANTAAVLGQHVPNINWAGFYLVDQELATGELVLGPFWGKPACMRIPPGKGVCGAAAMQRATMVVGNVHDFPGHIACDAASCSEIVVPLISHGRLLGVLDVDSPDYDRFTDSDRIPLEQIAQILVQGSRW